MRTFSPLCRRALAGAAIALVAVMTSTSVSAHETPTVSLGAAISDAIASISCPVVGDSQFSDSWGDRRSGGRRHEGVDMAADRGTSVVAALPGFAELKNTRAGGKSVWLTTPSGNKFFYAHLDEWEGESRDVAQGDVLGYVGSTGNAGGPHLHFEVRPGGRAINPYPATEAACTRADDDDRGGDIDDDSPRTAGLLPR